MENNDEDIQWSTQDFEELLNIETDQDLDGSLNIENAEDQGNEYYQKYLEAEAKIYSIMIKINNICLRHASVKERIDDASGFRTVGLLKEEAKIIVTLTELLQEIAEWKYKGTKWHLEYLRCWDQNLNKLDDAIAQNYEWYIVDPGDAICSDQDSIRYSLDREEWMLEVKRYGKDWENIKGWHNIAIKESRELIRETQITVKEVISGKRKSLI